LLLREGISVSAFLGEAWLHQLRISLRRISVADQLTSATATLRGALLGVGETGRASANLAGPLVIPLSGAA
jgi:hypothetical protein